MAARVDLPQEILDQATAILRRPANLADAARELGVPRRQLERCMDRARLLDPALPQSWDERIANKYLVVHLRAHA